MVIRLSKLSMVLIMAYIPLKPAGIGSHSVRIDHVGFETRQLFHEKDAGRPHRKGGRGKAVGLIHIRADHRQADDSADWLVSIGGIINMPPANVRAGGGDTAIPQRKHFYDLPGV